MLLKSITVIVFILVYQVFLPLASAYSDEIHLKNQDKITGRIIKETDKLVLIKTEAMGVVSVKRDYIEDMLVQKEEGESKAEKVEPPVWKREISIGYDKSTGNTDSSNFAFQLNINRKTKNDEFTLLGESYYSSSNKRMNTQKWKGFIRYATSFWEGKWYDFYKLQVDHDRFANINCRISPTAGLGYWFSDDEDLKLMLEGGIGYEYTDWREGDNENSQIVMVPRIFLEKKLIEQISFSEDISFYLYAQEMEQFRLRSETSFVSPVTEYISLKFSIIDEYNSNPGEDVKKNDFKLITSLNVSF